MADITLAEYDGTVWVVGGDAYLDDLLINALPPGISIEFVTCERKSDVHALWHRLSGEPEYAGDPWVIHPAIAKRFRPAPSAFAVIFAPWIVMPDAGGMQVIAQAAAAAADPGVTVVLAAYAEEEEGAAATELLSLRLRMIEDALQRADVPSARIARAGAAQKFPAPPPAGGGRIDILLQSVSRPD